MIESAFIVSYGRSGSTLLDRLVGTHPQALAVGELRHLPRNIALNSTCSCGARVDACPFWRAVVDECGRRLGTDLWREPYSMDLGYVLARFDLDPTHQTKSYAFRRALTLARIELALRVGADFRRSTWLAGVRRQIENNILLHEVLRQLTGCRLVMDSTKGFRWSIGQYLLQPDRARVVLLSRDGRGVMASMLRNGQEQRRVVRDWVKYYERALPWIDRHVAPEHVLRVRYEDLAGDTEATLARLFTLLDLPPVDAAVRAKRPEPHILEGNPMRHAKLGAIRLDERWRTELSPADLEVFEAEGRAMSRRLGYGAMDRS